QRAQARPRARRSENADDGCLAGLGVLAGLLADERRIAFDIEQIVRDLERLADGGAVEFERRTLRRVGLSEDAAGAASEPEEGPGSPRPARGRPRAGPAAGVRRHRGGPGRKDRASGRRPPRRDRRRAPTPARARSAPPRWDASRAAPGCRRRRSTGRRPPGWRW